MKAEGLGPDVCSPSVFRRASVGVLQWYRKSATYHIVFSVSHAQSSPSVSVEQILASPPCSKFSVESRFSANWTLAARHLVATAAAVVGRSGVNIRIFSSLARFASAIRLAPSPTAKMHFDIACPRRKVASADLFRRSP